MWIRSQDKLILGQFNCVVRSTNQIGASLNGSTTVILGEYPNEKRAVEVLDMIQDRIMKGTSFDSINNKKRTTKEFVFQMPERD
ncbi:hypothetical protein [Clostridium rectalis]|uniref:hypothetical protein n=1 Tax=Clostridium rectalis TaxID=2040295 RepID=UPI000F63CA3F|nr:hypothetical protein [Clostridium rectalis]